jgi:hypothetical protein
MSEKNKIGVKNSIAMTTKMLAMNRFLTDPKLHKEPIAPIAASIVNAPMKSKKSAASENNVAVSDDLRVLDAMEILSNVVDQFPWRASLELTLSANRLCCF